MVSAKLIGRLGNSMFQIAASLGYARKYGYEWAAQEQTHNNESSIHRVYPNLPKTNQRGVTYQEHPNEFCRLHNAHYNDCHFDYHPIPNLGGNVTLQGFFQSYKYFEGCDEEIKKIFALPHVEGYEDYVSIHVRRGDYVTYSGSFPPITNKYISAAYDCFHEDAKYLVFSDDIEWCKNNWRGDWLTFVDEPNELKALSMMASCGNHIIANSTFSWWASFLGHNPDRIVVTPSPETWFGPTSGVKRPVVDLLPSNWIKIHTR